MNNLRYMLFLLLGMLVLTGLANAGGTIFIVHMIPSVNTAYYSIVGSSIPISASGSGGSGNYNYTWAVASGSCPGFSNPGNSNTFTYTPTALTNNCVLHIEVMD